MIQYLCRGEAVRREADMIHFVTYSMSDILVRHALLMNNR